MNHLLLAALLLGPTLARTTAPTLLPHHAKPKLAYLCQGNASYAYHSATHCEGLAFCTTDLKKVTEAQAKELGRLYSAAAIYQRKLVLIIWL